jgi:hypothetical protein
MFTRSCVAITLSANSKPIEMFFASLTPPPTSVKTCEIEFASSTKKSVQESASISSSVKVMMLRASFSSSSVSSARRRAISSIASAFRRCHLDSRKLLLFRMNMPATYVIFSSKAKSALPGTPYSSAAPITQLSARIVSTTRSSSRQVSLLDVSSSRSGGTANTVDAMISVM